MPVFVAGGAVLTVGGLPARAGTPQFDIAMTGLTNGEAWIGTTIGYTITPDNGTETVAWGADGVVAAFGTGDNPTDFSAADDLSLVLAVTDGGLTSTVSAPVRYPIGTAPTIAAQAWTVDTAVNVNAAVTGSGLTVEHAATGLPAGVTMSVGGLITGTPTGASSGTVSVTGTDQYGRTVEYSFAYVTSAAGVPGQYDPPTLTATGTTVVVTLADAPSDGGSTITRRDIRHSTDESTWTEVTGISSPHTISSLSEGTEYFVQARAVNATGVGPWSTSASITTLTTPVITGVPSITGTAQVGRTLTANAAVVAGDPTPTRTWQWERAGTAISGATSSSYTLVSADEANTLTVVQTETNSVGSDSAESAATATVAAESTTTIEIGARTYSPGGGGEGPTLNISFLSLLNTTGPYTVFIATHANGTTLSKSDIENGTGSAEDHVSFSDADGVLTGQELTLSTSLTDGHLSFFIRDSTGSPVESAVIKIDDVVVDATAATLSSFTASPTGATTANYSITSDSTGTIHARVRPSADAAWTASEIIASPSDTITAISGANAGTISGLAASTEYDIDAVHVDAWGNVSTVSSSAAFTTDEGAPSQVADFEPVRLLETPYSDSLGVSATHTTANVTPTGGRPIAIVVHMQAGVNGAAAVTTATFGGVDVTPVETSAADGGSRVNTLVYLVDNPATSSQAFEIVLGAAPRSIVIEVLEIPAAATTATAGNAMTATASSATSATVSGTTGTAGSLVLYAFTKRYTAETVTPSGTDGNLSAQDSGDTSQFRDVVTMIAWEVVASAGAASASFSWTTAEQFAAVGIEVKAA